jgi:hypothetical protein
VYEILRGDKPSKENSALRRYKAKLVRLHAERKPKALLEFAEKDMLDGEEPSILQVLRVRKRRATREVTQVTVDHGNQHTTPGAIRRVFVKHVEDKYKRIEVDDAALTALMNVMRTVSTGTNARDLEHTISADELQRVVRAGARKKSPGSDGQPLEFYRANLVTIRTELLQLVNHMFLRKHITPVQKRGIIVHIPKGSHPRAPGDYRPITLLNTDYKLLARVIASRLRPLVAEHLHSSQFCGLPRNPSWVPLAALGTS